MAQFWWSTYVSIHVSIHCIGMHCLHSVCTISIAQVLCHTPQAKRVNIGVSIITSPVVLYLDEPTSGLDR